MIHYVVAAALRDWRAIGCSLAALGLSLAGLFTPAGLSRDPGSFGGLVFLSALAGVALGMDRLDRRGWPMQTLGSNLLLLRFQFAGLAIMATLIALPASIVHLWSIRDHIDVHLTAIPAALVLQVAALGLVLLQVRFSAEARSMCLVLLAWALPTVAPAGGVQSALLHATLGAPRQTLTLRMSDFSWPAWGLAFAPIVVLLGSAILVAELSRQPGGSRS